MDSYNLTNGLHMTQNEYLNNDVLKGIWGFKGLLMSDWDATYDGVAAANGGLDLEMPSGKFMNRENLLPAVKSGKVKEVTIDDKVRRILRTAIQFGWLDRGQTDLSTPAFNQEGRKVTLEAARSGMVLLKNEGNLLPFDKTKIKSIAVIGPNAYPLQTGGGGSADAKPFAPVGYVDGIVNELGSNTKVFYARGLPEFDDVERASVFTVSSTGSQRGLKAELFDNGDLQGAPANTHIDSRLHFEPIRSATSVPAGGSAPQLSMRWTGYFTPSSAAKYVALAQGPGENGGYRLYIDDKIVIDNWKQSYAFVSETPVTLAAGPHHVEFDYHATGGWGKNIANLAIVQPESLVTEDAKKLAAQSDVVVLTPGFNTDSEGESGDRTFALTSGQNELINQIAAINKNTVVVMTAGGGVDMTLWIDHIPALLQAWYPGQEGGTAVAQLLFGDFDPSGRLPISIERKWEDNPVHDNYYPKPGSKKVEYKEGIFVGYRGYDKSGTKPLFPFGYGLSYTSFIYKNLTVSHPSADRKVTVGFDITNTGPRAGSDVAEVYVGDKHAPVPRPAKELKGFDKVSLNPGETKHVEVTLDRRAFSYYDVKKHDWAIAPGDFEVIVGRSSADILLNGRVTLP